MWAAATLAVVVLHTAGASLNTGVGNYDGAYGSVSPQIQLRVNRINLGGPLSDLQMAEQELERLYSGDMAVASTLKRNDKCPSPPDCSNCRDGFPPVNGNMTDDQQCCIGLPSDCGMCSEILPESVYKVVNDGRITGTWRVTRCEQYNPQETEGLCDPCKPDRTTDFESSQEVYCSESEDPGRLQCYPRTPDKFQIKCNPSNHDNDWYGGWEVKRDIDGKGGSWRPCLQR